MNLFNSSTFDTEALKIILYAGTTIWRSYCGKTSVGVFRMAVPSGHGENSFKRDLADDGEFVTFREHNIFPMRKPIELKCSFFKTLIAKYRTPITTFQTILYLIFSANVFCKKGLIEFNKIALIFLFVYIIKNNEYCKKIQWWKKKLKK
mgnify:CR=1 FL=1